MPFLQYWKLAVFVVLGLLILGLYMRCDYLEDTVAERDAQILADNGTIENFQRDQKQSAIAKAALEEQVKDCQANAARYRTNQGKIDQMYHGPRPVVHVPATQHPEVLSREDSARAADLLNGLLDGVR